MATCKECLHYEPCYEFANILDPMGGGIICDSFKDKSKYAEVKHREWIKQPQLGENAYVCSECKTLGSLQWKCCPVCEAKMDRGEE